MVEILYVYDAKGCNKAFGRLNFVDLLVAMLNYKWLPSRFQNGRHFQHILDYISACELFMELTIVEISMFMMIRKTIQLLDIVSGCCSFGSH